jgi:hypothetical protein
VTLSKVTSLNLALQVSLVLKERHIVPVTVPTVNSAAVRVMNVDICVRNFNPMMLTPTEIIVILKICGMKELVKQTDTLNHFRTDSESAPRGSNASQPYASGRSLRIKTFQRTVRPPNIKVRNQPIVNERCSLEP